MGPEISSAASLPSLSSHGWVTPSSGSSPLSVVLQATAATKPPPTARKLPSRQVTVLSKPLPPSPRSVSSLSRAKLTHTLSSTSLPRPSWAGLSSATTAPSLCLLAPPAVISLPRSKRRPSRFLFCSSFVFVLPYILTHTHT